MVYACIVTECRGNYKKDGVKVSTFGFPRDEALTKKWISSIPNKFKVTTFTRVCELHFAERDIRRSVEFIREKTGKKIVIPLNQPRLQKGAIPSIFLPLKLAANAASAEQVGNNAQETKKEENSTVTNVELDIKIEPSDDYEEPSLPVIGEVFSKNDADAKNGNNFESPKQDLCPKIKVEISEEDRNQADAIFSKNQTKVIRGDSAKETSNILQETSFASNDVSQNITLQNSDTVNDESQTNLNRVPVYCEENKALFKSVIQLLNDSMKEDKFDLIGKLCAFRLKSLRTNQCSYAKVLITEVLDNAQFGYLNYKYVLPKSFPSRGQSSKLNSSGQEVPLNEMSSDPLFKSKRTYADIHKSNSGIKHQKQYFCSEKIPLLDKIKKLLEDHSKKDQFVELGEHYAKRLRAVSHREYVNAEKLIADILFYAELGCLYPDVLTLDRLADYSKKFCCHDNFLPKKKNAYAQTLSSESSSKDKSEVLSFQALIKSADLLMKKPADKSLSSISNTNIVPPVLPFPDTNSNSTLLQNNSSICQTEVSNLNPTSFSGTTSHILPPPCSSNTVLSDKLEQHPLQTLINSANLLMEKQSANMSSSLSTEPGISGLTQRFLNATTGSYLRFPPQIPNITSIPALSSPFMVHSHSSTTEPSLIKPVQTVTKPDLTHRKVPSKNKISDPSQSYSVTESTSNNKLTFEKLVKLAHSKKKSLEVLSHKDHNKSSEMLKNMGTKDISDSSCKQTSSTSLTEFSNLTSIDTNTSSEISSTQSSFTSASLSDQSEDINSPTLLKSADSIVKRPSRKRSYQESNRTILPKPSTKTKNIGQNSLNPNLMDTNSSSSDTSSEAPSLKSLSSLADKPCAFETSKSSFLDKSESLSETDDRNIVNEPTRKSTRKCARKSFPTARKAKETVPPVSKSTLGPSLTQESSSNSALSKRTSCLSSTAPKSSSAPTSSFPPSAISTGISNLTPTPITILSNSSTEGNTTVPLQSTVSLTPSVVAPPPIQASSSCFSPTVISNITPTFAPFNSYVTLPTLPVNSQPLYMIPMNQPTNYATTMNTGPLQFSLNILPPR